MVIRIYLSLSVAIATASLSLGLLGLRKKNEGCCRIIFFLMCLSLAWFLFSAGNSVQGYEKSNVLFWYRLSSFGFAPFYALNLNFFLYIFSEQASV